MSLSVWIGNDQFVVNCNHESPFDDIVSAFEVIALDMRHA